ncbi:helix-turn-helix transcriptional regulator [Actinomycetospora termitidis]|uniref:WYL domain-containing protein n=1 Tax=Actinomycetospora termitidis TaxID=3053470 RepID=A0ABT7ME76_9PSEU|nr:WYL domain-containing protein [Actinomycetospora sp. Odt1-22]MDL5158177.1 WYL domain-containing protein [Actinomycetospora sp. Odt1-22]
MSAEGVAERLPRLLTLVPWLLARPGVPVAEAAAEFGITEAQLRRDLELLWMCGLPGYGPGDLVDLSFEGDTITVVYDAGLSRPLRLSGPEAATLAVALRALADAPGVADTDAVYRALAKIEEASGRSEAPDTVAVGLGRSPGNARAEALVRDAVARHRALRLTYYSASRDAVGRRDVDPMRLLLVDGSTYLEAWCRRAEGVRMFRLDRVDDAEVLDEPSHPPSDAVGRDVPADASGLLTPDDEQRLAALRLAPEARWVAEYYPMEDVVADDDGSARVQMRYGDRAWMVRLLLGLGDAVEVLWPADLAVARAERAREALAAYGAL